MKVKQSKTKEKNSRRKKRKSAISNSRCAGGAGRLILCTVERVNERKERKLLAFVPERLLRASSSKPLLETGWEEFNLWRLIIVPLCSCWAVGHET